MNEPRKPVVLFLCTGNSARSQMAEALLRQMAGDRFEVHSAGLEPKPINPLTHKVMAEIGISTEGQHSKSSSDYLGKVAVRHAVIVCEKAQKSCPTIFPFAGQTHYWPFEDPAAFNGSEEMRLQKFRQVRDAIKAQLSFWLIEQEAA